jgi:HlyD family type I secretion membrane fusion protein
MALRTIDLTAFRRGLYMNVDAPERLGLFVLAGFVGVLTLWGSVAPLSGAAIAPGSLQVEGQRQSVQHPYGGVVQRLRVRDGDHVTKGQVLIELSDADPRARLDVLNGERDQALAEESRLIAERDRRAEPEFASLAARRAEPAVAQAMANETAIMAARARQNATSTAILRQRLAQLGEVKSGLRAQIDGLSRQRGFLEEEANGARQLLTSGYTPRTRVLNLERNLAAFDADRGQKLAELARAEEASGEAELELARQERSLVTEVTEQLRQVQAKLATLAPKIAAAADMLERTQVTAPATGAVVGLAVFTEGGVVQPGARLMDVVPSDNPLVVDARLQVTDINDVALGRAADVRLVSVNRNERPQLRGEITMVSADRSVDERSGQAYYPIKVRLNAEDVKGARLELRSGMAAEVVVTTQARTLIQYLAGPLIDEITGSFREK